MTTRIPDTTDLISDEALEGLSMGRLQALQLRVVQHLQTRVTDPTAYHAFARHDLDSGADWGTKWQTEQPPRATDMDTDNSPQDHHPVPPQDYFNTLPGLVDNIVSARRVQDAIITALTGLADRAYDLDRDTLLGLPAKVDMFKTGKRWLADRFQIDSRQMGKFYARAELIAAEPTTIAGVGQGPLLPKLAQAYAAGTIPSENLDRMSQIAKRFYDFYNGVGLSKENATEILQTMDPIFTDAAQRMTAQQLAQESTAWLNQIAHIVAPDGPPPEDLLTKTKNSLHTKIVRGKLHINIITDIVNLELIEALVLAGLNYKVHQDRFRQDVPEESSHDTDNSEPTPTKRPEQSDDESDPTPSVTDRVSNSAGSSPTRTTEADGEDATILADREAADRLRTFHQRMDDAVDDPETFVETDNGEPVSRESMRKLDARSRAEKAHDVFMTILKAQGKRSPGADGMPQYKRAPSILWTVMDYETLIRMQQDRLEPHFHLEDRHKRAPHMVDTGPPARLDPLLHLRGHHDIDDHDPPDDDDTVQQTSYSEAQSHPYVSHRFQTGSVSPAAVLQDLCDAKIIPAIFNQAGVPLFLGRGKRIFSDDQILAAGMRGGCRGPGCRVPPVWTQGHHAHYWGQNGGTDTTNLILLCNACHTRVHQGVWKPTWNADGLLYWIPAPWLDPIQTPVRNTYWDT